MSHMKHTSTEVALCLVFALLSSIAIHVEAASLSYSTATNIYLSSAGFALSIQPGSLADNLAVNATSVAITLSSSTGGTFTLTSPQALSSSTVGSGGSLSQTCSSGIETDTITQTSNSETYTLTPTGSACVTPQSQSGGGGGGRTVSTGGGGSAYNLAINAGVATTATTSVTLSLYGTAAYTMEVSNTSTFAGATWIPYATTMPWTLTPSIGTETIYAQFRAIGGSIVGSAQASISLVTPTQSAQASSLPNRLPTPIQTPSSESPADQLKALQAQLALLLAQANHETSSSSTHIIFARNLRFGMTGSDVKELQLVLIRANDGLAAERLKAHGTTMNFATLTLNALIEFQKKAGINPAIGYFGPITRTYVNNLLQ